MEKHDTQRFVVPALPSGVKVKFLHLYNDERDSLTEVFRKWSIPQFVSRDCRPMTDKSHRFFTPLGSTGCA